MRYSSSIALFALYYAQQYSAAAGQKISMSATLHRCVIRRHDFEAARKIP